MWWWCMYHIRVYSSEEVIPHIDSTSALCLFDHLNFQEDIDKMK